MRTLRSLLTFACYFFAALLALAALAGVLSTDLVDYSIQNGRKIDAVFGTTADIVEKFIQSKGRFPNEDEFKAAVIDGTPWNQTVKPRLHTSDFPAEAVKHFGPPPAGTYVLSYSRDEWMEYYPSWKRESTTGKSREQYFLFGSVYGQTIAFLIGAMSLVAIARFVRCRA